MAIMPAKQPRPEPRPHAGGCHWGLEGIPRARCYPEPASHRSDRDAGGNPRSCQTESYDYGKVDHPTLRQIDCAETDP